MSRLFTNVLAVVVVALSIQVQANAKANLTLIIEPFHNATGDSSYDYLAEGIPDILLDCLSSSDRQLSVVDRADVINRHDEQTLVEKLDYRGATIGASHLLRGSLTETEKGLKLFTLVFEISTTRLAYAASLQINNFYIEDRACRNWQEQLLKANASQTELVLTAERFPERQAQIDTGISHFHNGEQSSALSVFLQLSQEYPGDPEAEYWLAKTLLTADLYALAKIQIEDYIERYAGSERAQELALLLQKMQSSEAQHKNIEESPR